MEYISPHSLAQLPSLVFYKYKQKTKKEPLRFFFWDAKLKFFHTVLQRITNGNKSKTELCSND
jgi:hypothetical protein